MPVGQYTDEAIARQELRLLRRHPQPVAASASLSLTYVGVPLLLVRQEKGQVQAFRNSCPAAPCRSNSRDRRES
ncbi:hypothetical protein [Variovorax paradoxus]|uniref:hypothetical protein n=1 Tax=Variovorax paradoxus TaxID=34073 RepID=UPI00064A4C6E|nr:hypothetical protein [Variovorax paradoxus]